MINFTPPIKASLLIALVYAISFQVFVQNGNVIWLLPSNIFFVFCLAMYIRFLSKKNVKLTMPALTVKGLGLSFTSALLCLAGAVIISLINLYLFPAAKHIHLGNIRNITLLVFSNAFLINFVCGSLAAFITAGLMNEKGYALNAKHLPSVKR